jgi:prepilin-type N-terminal cleavage/methylation domain-containing protein
MRRGFSAVEVMVAVMVAASIGIPLLTLMFQERDSEQRSRFEYIALIAARDAAYEARTLVACGVKPEDVKLANAALDGNPLAAFVDKNKYVGNPPDVKYPPEQKRIVRDLAIDTADAAARVFLGKVTARWLDAELAKQDKRRSSLELVFGVAKPPGAP